MQKLARVSSKGQVVIPVEMRRKHNISKNVLIKEEKGR
ncbi:MAG: AbrB/MazE/SpoVT family DNA-binding domain-containing protein, partial [Nitrososphaerota archaeon]|nr:AbrB/MazE/SpoVT family DNA-binding domain-containing protein [Nitrososphaerota archaeon]